MPRPDTEEDLTRALNKLGRSSKHPLMVEEFIETEKDLGIMGFCDGTHCVVPAIVDLLESGRGAHKGVSAFGMVRKEKKGEGLAEKVGNLAKSIGLFGLFNVDLAISKGKVYFIELNLRYAAYGYAITGIKCREAILESADGFTTTTSIPRDTLIRTQTPQTFRLGNIIAAHEEAREKGITESVASCTLCAELGNREMHIVPGSEKNIKVTTVEDLEILKALMHTTKEDWLK